jgi:hypothetical protein
MLITLEIRVIRAGLDEVVVPRKMLEGKEPRSVSKWKLCDTDAAYNSTDPQFDRD